MIGHWMDDKMMDWDPGDRPGMSLSEQYPDEFEPLPFELGDELEQQTSKQILQYMIDHVEEFVDPFTDEVNVTTLAEETAVALGHPEWVEDEQHVIWDHAVDVGDSKPDIGHDDDYDFDFDAEMDARDRSDFERRWING